MIFNESKPLILIADDNTVNLQILQSVLKKFNYNYITANNGIEVLELMKESKPDLILLDIMMPELDGYQVCKKLKEDQNTENVPVIFLTAKTETEDIVKGFELGAVDYVTKPFNLKELMARVKTHIELKRSRDEIKTLVGILPICAQCKKVRSDNGYWSEVESYMEKRSDLQFSHGICPDCFKELYPKYYKK